MPFAVWAIAVLVVTAGVFAAIGVAAERRSTSLERYITARGSLATGAAVSTLVASSMGAWILFSPPETATWAGLVAVVGYAVGSVAPLAAFAVIGPRLRALMPEGHSLTEYVWHRFGSGMYVLTLAFMTFYMFIYLTAELTAMALAAHLLAGTPLGVTAAVATIPDTPHDPPPWDYMQLLGMKQRFADAGLDLQVIESAPYSIMEPIRLGLPNSDERIERFCELLMPAAHRRDPAAQIEHQVVGGGLAPAWRRRREAAAIALEFAQKKWRSSAVAMLVADAARQMRSRLSFWRALRRAGSMTVRN